MAEQNIPAPAEQAAPPQPAVSMERPVEARVHNLVEMVNRAYCTDDDSLSRCVDLDKALQQAEKSVNDEHKAMTEGITASKRYIDEKKRRQVTALAAARKHVQGNLIAPYRKRQKEEAEASAAAARKEAEDKALEEAGKLEAQGDVEGATRVVDEGAELAESTGPAHRTGPVRGYTAGAASFREVWQHEIEDPEQVPREYCSPDERKIREAVRRDENPVREIPGVRIWPEEKMANR